MELGFGLLVHLIRIIEEHMEPKELPHQLIILEAEEILLALLQPAEMPFTFLEEMLWTRPQPMELRTIFGSSELDNGLG